MILMDVNVLVHAFRKDMPEHQRYRDWLLEILNGPAAFGVCNFVFSGFLRVVTHPKVFKNPSGWQEAIAFVDAIRLQPNCRKVSFGERHWTIFADLCRTTRATGNLIPDAFLAALAIESGCEWITTDRDYAKFPGLRWRHPLD